MAALGAADGREVFPRWAAIRDDAGATNVVHADQHLPPAKYLGDGAVRLEAIRPPKPQTMVNWDILTPCDLSDAAGIELDLRCPEEHEFAATKALLVSGKGVYVIPFSIYPSSGWRRIRLLKANASASGKVAGWNRISAVRIYFNYSVPGTTTLDIANPGVLRGDPAELGKEAEEEGKRLMAAYREKMASRVASMPGRSGERRMICVHPQLMKPDIETVIARIARSGFTDVIALVSYAYTAYYPSKVIPTVAAENASPLVNDKTLSTLLDSCKRHGMKLHAWHIFFSCGKRLTKEQQTFLKSSGRLAKTHSGTYGKGLNLCPSHPENRRMEIETACELADMGVDGVLFDYIRYISPSYCFCEGCRARFEASVGSRVVNWPADVRGDGRLAEAWLDFRRSNITAIVRGIAERVRAKHPGMPISLGARSGVKSAREKDGQDWKLWCREGWIDILCPMDYTTSAARLREMIEAQRTDIGKAEFVPILGLSSQSIPNDGLDFWRMARQIETVRDMGVKGFNIFSWGERGEIVLDVLDKGPLRK